MNIPSERKNWAHSSVVRAAGLRQCIYKVAKGCLRSNLQVIPVKFGEAYVERYGNPEPSLKDEEGVETRRQAPHRGEGIVQTTNPQGAAKAVVECITGWSQVRILVGPSVTEMLYCSRPYPRGRKEVFVVHTDRSASSSTRN